MKTSAMFHSLKVFLDTSRAAKKRLVICYVDRAGHTILLWRETDAWLGSLKLAKQKAWTAIAFSGPTEDQALTPELAVDLLKEEYTSGRDKTPNLVFGGGIPIYVAGRLHGAVGVSGDTLEVDTQYAQLAVAAYLNSYLEHSPMVPGAPQEAKPSTFDTLM